MHTRAQGKSISQWSVFREKHPGSSSAREQKYHYHMIVETERASRWRQVAGLLRAKGIYASVSTVSVRNSYWRAFSYCYVQSTKKPRDDLDIDFLLSPGHEDPPYQMQQRRSGIRRISPNEVFETIVAHGLTTPLKFYAFAARQHGAGDKSWVQYCMTQKTSKIKATLETATAMSSAASSLQRLGMSHMDFLREALDGSCICEGHAIAGWRHILAVNHIDEARYLASLRDLFAGGGGKGLNHFYVGDPSTGKTALTRPLLALFGKYAFVKPQVHTTFALQGVIGAKAIIWNDFRWPHPPLAWGDLLNLFDNEPFKVAVPKVDGGEDYHWNSMGDEGFGGQFPDTPTSPGQRVGGRHRRRVRA